MRGNPPKSTITALAQTGKRLGLIIALVAVTSLGGCAAARRPVAAQGREEARTVLAVVAHPDDENMMGDVLAKLARQGHKVQVIIATDGKTGTRVTSVPAGDVLGALRRRESECACDRLRIPRPIFLAIDALDTRNGVRAYLDGRKELLAALERHLASIEPDALITFGPDGEYGHPEHIVVGAAVTELLLKHGLVDKYPLYFFASTREQVSDDPDLSYVDNRYLDLRVQYTDEDEQKSLDAARCYVTQSTPAEIDDAARRKVEDRENTTYFRKFHVGSRQGAERGALDEW